MDVVVTTDGVAKAHGVSPQQPDRYVRMLAKTQSPNAPNLNQPGSRTPLPNRNAAPTQQIASAGPTNQVPANQASYAKPGYALPQSTTPAMNRRPAMNQQAVNQQAMNQQAMNQQQATMTPPAAMNQPPAVAVPPRNPAPQNKLASARMQNNTAGMTLSMPEQVTESAPPSRPTGTSSGDQPTLAMEGFCSVSVINESRWVEGKPDFGVVHLGKLYLFASEAAMKEFLANPMPYTPVLNEIDVVRFFEDRAIVSGSREWAVTDPSHKRMFFFADEAAMIHFQNEYARYVDAAIEVMDKAVSDANPGS
jgi:protein disulfide-isomerase